MNSSRRHNANRQFSCRGFTLVELMITIAIVAISITLAGPPLQTFIKNNRLTTVANGLVSAVTYARNEAVNRRETITIMGDDGWWVQDSDGNKLSQYIIEPGVQMSVTGIDPDEGVKFAPDGYRDRSAGAVNVVFVLCDPDIDNTRTVTINPTGSTSVVKGTSGC